MSLQDMYYLTNIIVMSLMIFIMIAVVVILFYIWKKIADLSDNINEKINRITSEPSDFASSVGATVAASAIKGVSSFINRKKKRG